MSADERVIVQITEGEFGVDFDFIVVDEDNDDVDLETDATVTMKAAKSGETSFSVGTGAVVDGAGTGGEDVARVTIAVGDVTNLTAGRYRAQVKIVQATSTLIPEWFWLVVEEAI